MMDKQELEKMKPASVVALAIKAEDAMLRSIGLKPDIFNRQWMSALGRNPRLMQCRRSSLFDAIVQSIRLGLPPDGRSAAIIPFKDTAQFMPMIGGLMDIARDALPGASFHAGCIDKNDRFEYREGLNPVLDHFPSSMPSGHAIAAYAVVELPGGGKEYVFMWREQIEARRQRGGAWKAKAKDTPWDTDWNAMAEKTVLRAVLKRLPIRARLMEAVQFDSSEDIAPMPVVGMVETEEAPPADEKPKAKAREATKTAPPRPKAEEEEAKPAERAAAPKDEEDKIF